MAVMIEVHSGSRPGQPVRLLTLVGVALVGALCAAFSQVQASRRLGPEVHIPGTPVSVRPPEDWVPDPHLPGSFFREARITGWGGEQTVPERRVTIGYFRSSTPVTARDVLEKLGWPADARPARIGPLDGVQARIFKEGVLRGHRYTRELVLRVATTPRGDVISVRYEPLMELSLADYALLDDICRSIRIHDAGLLRDRDVLLREMGLALPEAREWRWFGGTETSPGVHGQRILNGAAQEAISVHRTWTQPSRSGADLVKDLVSEAWELSDLPEPTTRSRPDGMKIAGLVRPPELSSGLAAAWVAWQDERAVAVLVYGADGSAAGMASVSGLLDKIGLEPHALDQGLAQAREAGARLAERVLSTAERARHWGDAVTGYYVTVDEDNPSVWIDRVTAVDDDSQLGFRGDGWYFYEDKLSRIAWGVGAGERYWFEWDGFRRRPPALATHLRDEHSGQSLISHREVGPDVVTNAPPPPPAGFVSQPLEELAEFAVAHGDPPVALIWCRSHWAPGYHSRLLRHLPPDEDGHLRVQILLDHQPPGGVRAFTPDRRLVYEEWAGRRMVAVPRERAATFLRRNFSLEMPVIDDADISKEAPQARSQ